MNGLVSYSPSTLSSLFDSLFSSWEPLDSFSYQDPWDKASKALTMSNISPKVDVVEEKDSYRILAEIPGLDKKDISVEVSDGILTIKGEKKEEKVEKDKDKSKYHYLERSYGSYVRQFKLSEDVDHDSIGAKYSNGVLELTIRKSEKAKPKQIEIKVE
jgi:HSP20 family protein